MSIQTIEFSNIKHSEIIKIPKFFSTQTPNLKIVVSSSYVIGDSFIAEATYKTTQMDNSISSNKQSLVTEETIINGDDFGNKHNEIESIIFFTSPENILSGKIIISTL